LLIFFTKFGIYTPPLTQTKYEIIAQLPLFENTIFAASILQKLPQPLYELPEFHGIVFGTNIGRAIIYSPPSKYYFWPRMTGDLDIYITIVSLEQSIVNGLMLFDEVRL